jgi:hypothetical protein
MFGWKERKREKRKLRKPMHEFDMLSVEEIDGSITGHIWTVA